MSREGFRQLYEQIPSGKPPFGDVRQEMGGNPRILLRLYRANWSVDTVVWELIRRKGITPQFIGG